MALVGMSNIQTSMTSSTVLGSIAGLTPVRNRRYSRAHLLGWLSRAIPVAIGPEDRLLTTIVSDRVLDLPGRHLRDRRRFSVNPVLMTCRFASATVFITTGIRRNSRCRTLRILRSSLV